MNLRTPLRPHPALLMSLSLIAFATAAAEISADPLAADQTRASTRLPAVKVEGERPDDYRIDQARAATKTDTPLRETPMSISIITRELLRDQQVQNFNEALRYVPGVYSGANGRDGFNSVQIRGFGAAPSTLRDGTRQSPFNIIAQDPYGLERVEVLRGPTSVLYGQSGPGGLVNMVSKQPGINPIREFNATLGSLDYRQMSGDYGHTLDRAGHWNWRVVGRALERDDDVDFADERRFYLAPSLSWQAGADTRVTLLTSFADIEVVRINELPVQGTLLPNVNGEIPRSRFTGEPDFDLDDKDEQQFGSLVDHRFGQHWTLRQNLRYSQYDALTQTIFQLGLQEDQRTYNRRPVRRDYEGQTFTVDHLLQGQWQIGRWSHTVLLGVDYLRYRESQIRFNGTVAALDLFEPVYGSPVEFTATPAIDNTRKLRQLGYYAQHQVKFDERWFALAGLRRDDARDGTSNKLNQPQTQLDDQAVTTRAGLGYLLRNGLTPYFSFGESFNPISGADASGAPFEPETGEQFEIGLKFEPAGARWSAAFAAFDLRRQNVPTPDPDDLSNRIQVGEQTHRGMELEVSGSVLTGLSVIGAVSVLDAEINRDNRVDASGNKTFEGKSPTGIPERQASLWTRYQMQRAGWQALGFGLGGRWAEGAQSNAANTLENPSYVLWDAALYWDQPGWSLSLNAKNLFDRDYFPTARQNTVVIGDPLTVLANVQVRW